MNRVVIYNPMCRLKIWLLAAAAIALVYCPVKAADEAEDSLYVAYLTPDNRDKTATANRIFEQLRQDGYSDTLISFGPSAKLEIVDAQTHFGMADYYFIQGQYEAALQAAERAAAVVDKVKDNRLKSDVIGTLANAHYRLGNYDKALETLIKAYRIDKQLGDDDLISSDLNTFAAIYLAVQQPEPGINYITQAIAIERRRNSTDRLAIRLGMASELYLMNGQTDKAMEAIKEAYRIDLRDGREGKAAIRLSQMGAIQIATSQLDQAKVTVTRALKVLEREQNIYSIGVCHNQLGNIALEQGNRGEAAAHFKQALEHGIRCKSPKVEMDAEKGLWQALREENAGVAMLHLERYATLSDSLRNRIATTQFNVLNATLRNIEETDSNNSNRHALMWMIVVAVIALLSLFASLLVLWRTRIKPAGIGTKQANSEQAGINVDSLVDSDVNLQPQETGAAVEEEIEMTVEQEAGNRAPAMSLPDMSRKDREFITRLTVIIHSQMSKGNIDLEYIATAMSLTRKQLRDHVARITGLTPVAFVIQTRLRHACRLMYNNKLSMTAIAAKCGFQNLSHFSNVFKQHYGITPTQYRKLWVNDVT